MRYIIIAGQRQITKATLTQSDWDSWGRGAIEIIRIEWTNQTISKPVGQCEWIQLPIIQTVTAS